MTPAIIENLVPIFIMLGMFTTIFGIVYIRSRENMALIDRGMNPRQENPRPRYFGNLKYGLLLLGSGLGLISAYIMDVIIMGHKRVVERGIDALNEHFTHVSDNREPIIYFALIAIGGGLGLMLSYHVERKHWAEIAKKEAE